MTTQENGGATRWQNAIRLEAAELPGVWTADVAPGFSIADRANGGYLLALVANAAVHELERAEGTHPVPVAATASFLAAPPPGPARLHTSVLRQGRGTSVVAVELRSGDELCVAASVTCGALGPSSVTPINDHVPAPSMPPIEQCVRLQSRSGLGYTVAILDEVNQHADPVTVGWGLGQPSGAGEIRAWVSFVDEQEPDPLALVMLIDVLPPATFDLGHSGWTPTLSLTAFVRAVPAPGPLLVRQTARLVQRGSGRGATMDETCDVWDSLGRLVATGHQLAALRLDEV